MVCVSRNLHLTPGNRAAHHAERKWRPGGSLKAKKGATS